MTTYSDFFLAATGHRPYPYQSRLAEEGPPPQLLNIPTGAGKTAAVVLAWLWRRRFANEGVRRATPRRLVYCLPMRVLVEQTVGEARKWMGQLREKYGTEMADLPRVYTLMGGEVDEDWILYPERDAILIGTQDMLLSRALNRGYAESRFRWPISFGLLNSDVLWVLDEVQIMGPGLPTTAQLAAFRGTLGVAGSCFTLWMSATLRPEWLATVDFRDTANRLSVVLLGKADRRDDRLRSRMEATKVLRLAKVPGWVAKGYAAAIGCLVRDWHQPGSLSLVVVNTVDRAKQIFAALQDFPPKPKPDRRGRKTRASAEAVVEQVLVHSRFRPTERAALTARILSPLPPGGRIVVATQVVEAGVDISARLLVTELAPWASLVQRFGRCNRTGQEVRAEAYWLAPSEGEIEEKAALPYDPQELEAARAILRSLEGQSLSPVGLPAVAASGPMSHVLRRKDLVDLFDTSPDISGSDVDISRFIRDADDRDVHVFWRTWDGADRGLPPPEDMAAPHRDELCPAPLHEVREFLNEKHLGFAWDHLEDRWIRVRSHRLFPGMIVLFSGLVGGYSWDPTREAGLGWEVNSSDPVTVLSNVGPRSDTTREDLHSEAGTWVTLVDHNEAVVRAIEAIIANLSLDSGLGNALRLAARWHDAGKAHPVFRETLTAGTPPRNREGQIWAKSPHRVGRHSRPHFRHELASALALLTQPAALAGLPEKWRDLVVYLVAAHHGKVRLAARALPGERPAVDGGRFALGLWDGDRLSETELGGGVIMPATVLDLTPLEIGLDPNAQPSWIDRMLRLRDRPDLGPFRLAYCEALLRAADVRASREPGPEGLSRA